ncbi:hypothetical protein F511_46339 [Dorcoceras hygrometricum]|uniref:Uncharacterized protein n=1 Tax=Dorcoceras hygrometricum TaxID=472368 RepID=A0A2Z6ZTT0_9LAMI|nr:hypothetical protein F511_46339 [Dorcoceras hygrometricum]
MANNIDQIRETLALIPLFGGSGSDPPVRQRKNKNYRTGRRSIRKIILHSTTFIGCLACYLAGTCAWLQPVFQEPGASR